jgi:group I intron endonuclease
MATGIYCIRNLINGKLYIGSAAVNLKKRWYKHRYELRTSQHPNCHLQAAWRCYGPASFRFSVLEECPPEKCIEREQHFIDILDPEYNICRVAGSQLGHKHTPATCAKLSTRTYTPIWLARQRLSHLGKKHTLEARAKISASLVGHKIPPATRVKIRHALLGRLRPDVSARNIGNQYTLGHKCSLETRARMRIAHLGRKFSPGHCAKIRARMIGKKYSLGVKHSPETRAKLRAAWVLRKKRSITSPAALPFLPSTPPALPAAPV